MARYSQHISPQCEVREMLLALAELHGIRPDVECLLEDYGTFNKYEFLPLHMILRQRRKELGLTAKEMAGRSGLSKSQLVCLESEQPHLHMKRFASEAVLKVANGYELPILLVVSSAMRTAGLFNAPGA